MAAGGGNDRHHDIEGLALLERLAQGPSDDFGRFQRIKIKRGFQRGYFSHRQIMDTVNHVGPQGTLRVAIQFPSAYFAHAASRRQSRLLLRQADFDHFPLRDIDGQCVKSLHLIAVVVRQVLALPMSGGAIRAGIALIE